MSNDRLTEILARQSAAAEARRQRETAQREAAEKAAAKRRDVENLWKIKSQDFDAALEKLNALMKSNGIKLVKRWNDHSIKGVLDTVEVRFEGETYEHTLKRLYFRIAANGNVDVSMGTENHSPAKQESFTLDSASEETWTDSLIDFVDINTPR